MREELGFGGIEAEIEAFMAVVAARGEGRVPPADEAYRVSPEEGVRDLAVVEAMLASAAAGAAVVKVQEA